MNHGEIGLGSLQNMSPQRHGVLMPFIPEFLAGFLLLHRSGLEPE